MKTAKYSFVYILYLFFAALIATAICFTFGFAHAETANEAVAVLSPIEPADAKAVYHCFDSPRSVFADAAGILVSGVGTDVISSETEITAHKNINADKVYRHGEHGDHAEYTIALYDGKLFAFCGDDRETVLSVNGMTVTDAVDFCVDNDTLYAVTKSDIIVAPLAARSFDVAAATRTALDSSRHVSVNASAIAASRGVVYVSLRAAFGEKSDICSVSADGTLKTVFMQSDYISALSAYNDTVYALSRGDIVGYGISEVGGLVRKFFRGGEDFTAIYAYGEYVYALNTLNALHKLNADLSEDSTLLASCGDDTGFFDMPSGIAVKNSVLYVADFINDRIALYGDKLDYADRKFVGPISVACDTAGNAYVAYEYNKIGIFPDKNFSASNEKTISSSELGIIKQILIDADKTLFVLSDTGLWYVKSGETKVVSLNDTPFKYITLGIGKDELYALSDGMIKRVDKTTGEASDYLSVPSDAIAFNIDLIGTAAVLTPTGITVKTTAAVETRFDFVLDESKYSLGGKIGAIALGTVQNEFVKHGDIIIVDTLKHRLLKTDGKALGITLVDENYSVPDIIGNTNPAYHENGLIRTTLREAEIFSVPMETTPIYTVQAGRKVIVPQYVLQDTGEYSLVLVDDLERGRLIQGYIYRDALSEPLPYSPPPAEVGSIFNAATPIYKWPSRNASPVNGYSTVNRNTEFALLDFVESYRDDYGYLWYRVRLSGDARFEGYVLGINISLMSYEPVFIRPAYNAEIISYKGSTFAPAYRLEDGEYVPVAQLKTGTQVEVIGTFDTSERYTQVKYLDAELGTMTCYVETVYLRYNGVNVVLIVAVVVIVITVILASIIIARAVNSKKKKLDNDD